MMAREIGSEFWDVPVMAKDNGLFPADTQWFLSGRSALRAIINSIPDSAKTAALPSWCCESMVRPFLDAGLEVRFYSVYVKNGKLVQDIRTDADILFVMDYFGFADEQTGSKHGGGVVIRDMTHSVFSASYDDADFYFGSIRKWCGIWTGGFSWGRKLIAPEKTDEQFVALRKSAMEHKAEFIKLGETGEKEYLKQFSEAEDILDRYELAAASGRDEELIRHIDSALIRQKRRSNAKVLMEGLKDYLLFPEMKENDCPLFVPILVPDGRRNDLRRYLIDRSIYCPAHWPVSKYHTLNPRELFLYANEMSVVCDQRYDVNDMCRIVAEVKRFLNKNC